MSTSISQPQIVYIHPAKQRVGFPFGDPRLAYLTPFTLIPVGLIGLVNMLRQDGVAVRGVNYPAESFMDTSFDLRQWLRGIPTPRLIMIDLHWYEHAFGALDVARACKDVHPHTPVLVGGMTASLFAREILEHCAAVDYVIRGDAEEPLGRLAAQYCSGSVRRQDLDAVRGLTHRVDGEVRENPLGDCASCAELDGLNATDVDFMDHGDDYLGFQYVGRRGLFVPGVSGFARGHWLSTGRGCAHQCSFCGGDREAHRVIAGRQGFVRRSASRVADDIEALSDRGVQQVAFSLDPAVLGEAYWKALFGELARRRVRIGVYNEAFQLPSEAFIEAFAECADLGHSQLALSVLSGDEKVRQMNGKRFGNAELFAAVRSMRRHKIPLAVYHSFNLPGSDETALRKTIFVTEQIGRIYSPSFLMVYNQPHTIDPCSPMSRHPEDYDLEVRLRSFEDYYEYCQLTAVERPGVLGVANRGFTWRGRTEAMERRMQQLWLAFCRSQRFACG